MVKKVHIGVDGGGTKSAIAVALNGSEEPISSFVGESINYNFIGVEKAVDNLVKAIKSLPIDFDYEIEKITIGDPSIDDITFLPSTEQFKIKLAEKIGINKCNVNIKSDVFMALYGLTKGEAGAIIISGTGSIAMALDSQGKTFVSGGWGRLCEDEGSGYYIAVNGIKSALRYYDGVGPKTELLDRLKTFFNVSNVREIINIFYGDGDFPRVADFAKEVYLAAQNGDCEAISICYKAADYLSKYAESLINRANLSNCSLGIYGSILTKNEIVKQRFINTVSNKYSDIEIVVPDIKPEIAALIYNIKYKGE